jgi:hypothetical protein
MKKNINLICINYGDFLIYLINIVILLELKECWNFQKFCEFEKNLFFNIIQTIILSIEIKLFLIFRMILRRQVIDFLNY